MNWLKQISDAIAESGSVQAPEQQNNLTLPISRADLHVHTRASDGLATAEQVLEQVATAGQLRAVALTDHDTMLAPGDARRLQQNFGIEVIVGEEVSTQDGHLLALFIERPLLPGRPAAETIAAVHAQGGLCIAPHPYDWLIPSLGRHGLHRRCLPRGGQGEARDWAIDAIETMNASITWPATIANGLARRVATKLRLPVVGGSDTHTLATVGRAYTTFPGTTADDLYRAITQGTVAAAGHGWSTAQFIEFYRLTLRERSFSGALQLAGSNVALLH